MSALAIVAVSVGGYLVCWWIAARLLLVDEIKTSYTRTSWAELDWSDVGQAVAIGFVMAVVIPVGFPIYLLVTHVHPHKFARRVFVEPRAMRQAHERKQVERAQRRDMRRPDQDVSSSFDGLLVDRNIVSRHYLDRQFLDRLDER